MGTTWSGTELFVWIAEDKMRGQERLNKETSFVDRSSVSALWCRGRSLPTVSRVCQCLRCTGISTRLPSTWKATSEFWRFTVYSLGAPSRATFARRSMWTTPSGVPAGRVCREHSAGREQRAAQALRCKTFLGGQYIRPAGNDAHHQPTIHALPSTRSHSSL